MKFGVLAVALIAMMVMVGCATSPSLTIEGKSSARVGTEETFSATTKGAYPSYGVVYTNWGFAEGDRVTCVIGTSGDAPVVADEDGVVVDKVTFTPRERGTRWLCAVAWIYPGVNGAEPTQVSDWHRVVVR